MSQLPPGWALAQLGQLGTVGSSRRVHQSDWQKSGVPFYRAREIVKLSKNGSVDNDLFIAEELFEELSANGMVPAAGDVMITGVGTIGVPYRVRQGDKFYFKDASVLIFKNEHGMDPDFLCQFFRSPSWHATLSRGASGTTVETLTIKQASRISVPVAPLNEQRRIVAKIEELTARSRRAKEALDAVPPLLDKLRQSILAAAFRGDLTADWRAKNPNVEPADQLLARIRAERRASWVANEAAHGRTRSNYREATETVPEELRSALPNGWAWAAADECAWDITVGHVGPMKHRYVSKGIPFLRSQNVRENRFDRDGLLYIPEDFHAELRKSSLRPGDLVVVRSGAPGTACVIPDELLDANCADLVICRLVPSVLADLLCHFVNSQHAKAQVLDAQVGVAQQHFNIGSMRKLVVPLMPLEEQRELLGRISASFATLASMEAALEAARGRCAVLDTSVLARAFRGELVPQDPKDEPASVLLQRIRATHGSDVRVPVGRQRRHVDASIGEAEVEMESDDVIKLNVDLEEGGGDDWLHRSRQRRSKAAAEAVPLDSMDDERRHAAVFAALWTRGQVEKDAAVRLVALRLRDDGHVAFQRLRADGPLYAEVLSAIESAVKAGVLDRPRRGLVRAIKDAQAMTSDDWRHALVAGLREEPVARDEAIRTAAEWARDNMGVAFERLRADGVIASALRSAINSAIRRGEVIRHGASHIARAPADGHESDPADDAPDEDAADSPAGGHRIIPRLLEPRSIEVDKPVLVLQFDGKGSGLKLEHLAVMVLAGALSIVNEKPKEPGWTFFLGVDRPDVDGLSTWLGAGPGVPARVIDLIQQLLEGTQHRVGREYAVPRQHDLTAILVATADAIEVSDSGPDNEFLGRHFDEDVKVTRRVFVVGSTRGKSQQLNDLFFGNDSES